MPLPFFGGNVQRNTAQKKDGRDGTIWGDDKKVLWTDDGSLGGPLKFIYFLFIPPSPFPRPFYFALCTPAAQGGWFSREEKKHRDTLQDSQRMDQAGILRKFTEEVKAMSEGDEERGEDNFGSDFMVGQN